MIGRHVVPFSTSAIRATLRNVFDINLEVQDVYECVAITCCPHYLWRFLLFRPEHVVFSYDLSLCAFSTFLINILNSNLTSFVLLLLHHCSECFQATGNQAVDYCRVIVEIKFVLWQRLLQSFEQMCLSTVRQSVETKNHWLGDISSNIPNGLSFLVVI